MSYLKPSLKSVLPAVVLTSVLAVVVGALAQEKTLRFDCGTPESPVAAGYQRLTADDLYSPSAGYGWEGAQPRSLVFPSPQEVREAGSAGRPVELITFFSEHYNDLQQ